MCNQPCHDCNQPCFDAPLTPHWPAAPPPADLCDTLASLVDQLNAKARDCGLRASLDRVESAPGGFRITVAVTGNKGPVEVSLNRRTYTAGLTVTGAKGSAVVVYVREVRKRKCEAAVYVPLTDGCVIPVRPVVSIADASCNVPAGSIRLTNQPATATAYWYATADGSGPSTSTPPAYSLTKAISGSVRYCVTGRGGCCSELTTFQTKPQGCLCTGVAFISNEMPPATLLKYYVRRIALTGSMPFAITSKQLPAWMSAVIDNAELVLSGTPLPGEVSPSVSVAVGLSNCNGEKKAQFLTTMAVLSVNATIDSDWEVIGVRCRTCSQTPSLRISAIHCGDGSPTTNPCSSTTPQLKIIGVRCSPTDGSTGSNPCSGVGSSLKIAGVRCSQTATTTPVNPCLGVVSALKIIGIKCSQ